MAAEREAKADVLDPSIGEDEDDIGLHIGASLFRFANVYPTIVLTMVEAVQNAIDAAAKRVFVGIDLRTREIIVLDNGTGVTQTKFRQALLSIGQGIKKPGSLGRFGLGLISPLNKCRYFTLASHPEGSPTGSVWRFEGAVLRDRHHKATSPRKTVEILPPLPKQFVGVAGQLFAGWRTVVHMVGVSDDKIADAADLDELEGDIRTKLSVGMARNNTVVNVALINGNGKMETREINPIKFVGEKLEVFTFRDKDCGLVTFELHRAPQTVGGVRRGIVLIRQSSDNYLITWREFFAQAMGSKKLQHVKEAFDALGSGYFEGVIHAENIELDESRTKFRGGPPLIGLYVAMHAWYLEVGKALYELEHEARQGQRYQDLGAKSLQRVHDLMQGNVAFSSLTRRLQGVLPEGDKLPSTQPSDGKPRPSDPRQRTSTGEPRKRVVVDPPRERKPREPSHGGFGLRFAYDVLPHSNRLWEFTPEEGVLTFNIRHPLWVKLDETDGRHNAKNDRWIMHLQEWLALKLLMLLTHEGDPGFDLDLARLPVDEEVKLYAEMFILSAR